VDTNFLRVEGAFNPHFEKIFDVMYVNHYNTKSLEEYVRKLERGRGAMRDPQTLGMPYFHAVEQLCTEECPVLQLPPESREVI
jgi:hypothetical protein